MGGRSISCTAIRRTARSRIPATRHKRWFSCRRPRGGSPHPFAIGTLRAPICLVGVRLQPDLRIVMSGFSRTRTQGGERMRRILTGCAVALSMTLVASAQDSTIKSRTEIKADDATVFSMTGCLRQDVAGNFTLYGTSVKSREGVTTDTKVRTENDRDESKVTTTE